MSMIGELVVGITGDSSGLVTSLKSASDQTELTTKSLSDGFAKAGVAIMAALGIGKLVSEFKQFLGEAVTAVTDYGDSLSDLATVIGPDAAEGIGASLRQLSQEVPKTTTELLKIAETAAKLGLEAPEDIEKFTASVAKISIATGQQSEQIATDFGKILKVTGDSTDSMEGLGSAVNALADTMNTSAGDIIEAATKSANALAGVGVSTPDIVALAAAMQEISASGREAAAALKLAADALSDPKNAELFAHALGLTVDQFTTMRKENFVGLLGEVATKLAEGGEGSELIASTLGDSATKLKTLGNNWGDVEDAVSLANKEYATATSLQEDFNIKTEAMGARLLVLKNAFGEIKLSVGEALAPAISDIIKIFEDNRQGIADFFSAFAVGIANTFTWLIANKELVVTALAAILAAVLAFKMADLVASFNPVTLAFQAIAVAAAVMGGAIGEAIKRISEMKKWRAEWDAWEQGLEDAAEVARQVNAELVKTATLSAGLSLAPSSLGLFGDAGISAGFDIEGGLAPTMAQIDAAEKARAERMKEMWSGIGKWFTDMFSITRKTIDAETGKITEEFTTLGKEVSGALTGLFQGIAGAFLAQGNLAREHEDTLHGIQDEEEARLKKLAGLRDKDLASIQANYDAGLISLQEYDAQREAALAAYSQAEADAKQATLDALAEEEKAYEETKKSVWEILKETVRNVLTALKEELLLKAAAALAEAIALTAALSPTAALKYAQAAAYGGGAAGLMIAGFETGGVVSGALGEPQLVVAHGGEMIIPPGGSAMDYQAMSNAVALGVYDAMTQVQRENPGREIVIEMDKTRLARVMAPALNDEYRRLGLAGVT
jgi:TP901 family phage tail tape measure protein